MGKRIGVYKYIHALPRDAYGNRYRIGGKILSQKFGLGTVIGVLARGEFFGHMGYIAKEQTDAVRALARYAGCDLKDIAVQIVCTGDVGFKSVRLALIAAT